MEDLTPNYVMGQSEYAGWETMTRMALCSESKVEREKREKRITIHIYVPLKRYHRYDEVSLLRHESLLKL